MKDIMLNIESWDNVAAEVKTLIKMEDVFTKANNLLKTIDGYICSYDTNRSIAFSPKDNSALIDTTFSHLDSIKSFSSDGAAYVTDAFLVDFLNRLDAFIGTMQNLTPGNISVSSAPMQRPDGYSIPSQITMSELFGHGNVFDHMLYEEYQEYQMYLKNRGLDSVFSHYDKDGNPIYNDLDGISFEDFRSYLSYGRQIDYKSTKYYTTDEEWRRRVDFWVNVGIGVGILVATAVISCVGTPAAGAAFAGWAGSIYGLFQIGQGISGVSWITGRELDTGERIAFVVFGTLDMIPGIIALRNAYRLSLTGMQFTDETIEALEQMARTGDNAAAYMLKQLADNGNITAKYAYSAVLNESTQELYKFAMKGDAAAMERLRSLVNGGDRYAKSLLDLPIADGKIGGKIPVDEYIAALRYSTHNGSSDTLTLGYYIYGIPEESYNVIANSNGSMYFDTSQWNHFVGDYNVTLDELFEWMNKPALDYAIAGDKRIGFTHNPLLDKRKSTYKEWIYIRDSLGLSDDIFNSFVEGEILYVN